MFGPHLTLDLYGCNKKLLSNLDFVTKILEELPDLIGMHKISEPFVLNYDGNSNSFDKGGISAFIIIAESHISIHTFPEQEFASVDVFSCKNFDIKIAENYLIEKFDAKKVEKHFIMRGKEFPRDIEKAKEIVLKERKKCFNF